MTTDIADLIRQRISECQAELVKLERILTVLESDSPATVARSERRRKPVQRRRSKTKPSNVPTVSVADLLTDEGATTVGIAGKLSVPTDRVLAELKALERSGAAHRTGTRRSTRWFPGPA